MIRVATFNVNGIRAAEKRGFRKWLIQRNPDIICLQETRANDEQIPEGLFDGWHLAHNSGILPGRNGVAILTRSAPIAIRTKFAKEFDKHGRWIEVDLPGITVASLYLPKGASPYDGEAAQEKYEAKRRFCAELTKKLTAVRRSAQRSGNHFIVAGDFNIAHTELDLTNPKSNTKNPGFLPTERTWFDTILSPRSLHDTVREFYPGTVGPMTWWTWRGQAWQRDTGWRVDYQLVDALLAKKVIEAGTDRDQKYEERISDHAPVVVDYDISPPELQ